jgi:hypothetical protein
MKRKTIAMTSCTSSSSSYIYDLTILFRSFGPLRSSKEIPDVQDFGAFLEAFQIEFPSRFIPFKELKLYLKKYPLTIFLISRMNPETDTLECVHTFSIQNGRNHVQTFKTIDEAIERCSAGYDQISNELVSFQYNDRGSINIVDK